MDHIPGFVRVGNTMPPGTRVYEKDHLCVDACFGIIKHSCDARRRLSTLAEGFDVEVSPSRERRVNVTESFADERKAGERLSRPTATVSARSPLGVASVLIRRVRADPGIDCLGDLEVDLFGKI
jgi:hypothetical protein